jgi:hypothetical protein
VRVLGHTRWVLGTYLHDLCDHGIQTFYRSGHGLRLSGSLLDCRCIIDPPDVSKF